MLPPPAGGSLRQNRGKIGCSILVVVKVVSAPARFGERGARCFVGRLSLWSGWWRSVALVWRKDDEGVINLLERNRQIVYAVCIVVYRCFPVAADS